MKTHSIVRSEKRKPRKRKLTMYDKLEIAMERHAPAVSVEKEEQCESTELTGWTGAEADTLEP